MDALVIACSRNTKVIMVLAWMLWSSYAPMTVCFGVQPLPGGRAQAVQRPRRRLLQRAVPHGGNAVPLRADPGASPAAVTEMLLKPTNAGSTRLRPTLNKGHMGAI